MNALDIHPTGIDMQVLVEPEFDFRSPEYRALFAQGGATAFQAPLFQHHLHASLAPRVHAHQRTITLRAAATGELLAVFPLVTQRWAAFTVVGPADFGVADYNAVIARPGVLEVMASNAQLRGRFEQALRGHLLMFRKLRDDSFDLTRILPRMRHSPAENAAYHSVIDEDFDTWRLRTLSRHATKEFGRKSRQFQRDHGDWELREVSDAEGIEQVLTFIRDARQDRFEGDLLQNPAYFDFYRAYATAAAPVGEAIVYAMYQKGAPVAALYGLAGDGVFHAVLIAADMQRYARYSLGTQLIYHTIRRRYEEGHRLFDMGLGNTGYKSHFRVETTQLRNLTLTRTPVGAGIALVYHHMKPLKDGLSRLVPHVR